MNPRSLLGVFCALNILVYLDRGREFKPCRFLLLYRRVFKSRNADGNIV